MDQASVAAVLSKLRVNSGLKSNGRRPLGAGFSAEIWYSHDSNAFMLGIYYGGKTKEITPPKTDFETRSKSMWLMDQTWRLTEDACARHAEAIFGVIQRTLTSLEKRGGHVHGVECFNAKGVQVCKQ